MGLLPSESVLFPREVWNSPAFGQVSQGVFCQGHLKSLLLQVRAALGWVWPQGSGIPHPLVALKLWALPQNPLRAVRSLTFFFPCLFISVDLILLNLWQRSLMEILNRAAAMQQENKELPPTPRPFPIYLPIKKNYNFFLCITSRPSQLSVDTWKYQLANRARCSQASLSAQNSFVLHKK